MRVDVSLVSVELYKIRYIRYTRLEFCKLACEQTPDCTSIDYSDFNPGYEMWCQLWKDFGNDATGLIPANHFQHFTVKCPPGKYSTGILSPSVYTNSPKA